MRSQGKNEVKIPLLFKKYKMCYNYANNTWSIYHTNGEGLFIKIAMQDVTSVILEMNQMFICFN